MSRLYCFGNRLNTLPTLPKTITWLDCSYNQLSILPELPDSLHSFDCHVNVSLYCLPELKKIIYFSFDSTAVTCLPDYPQDNISSTPPLSTISVCGLSNPHGCLTSTSTGIPYHSEPDAHLLIYPNPASDKLTVKTGNSNMSLNYTLMDIEGREILSGLLADGTTSINIPPLTAGIYILHINGQIKSSFKIVKD
jgi:hypothetical protein